MNDRPRNADKLRPRDTQLSSQTLHMHIKDRLNHQAIRNKTVSLSETRINTFYGTSFGLIPVFRTTMEIYFTTGRASGCSQRG